MEMLLTNVHWTAVVVGAVLSYLLGWLWYSDWLFGQKWRAGIGIAVDDNTPMAHAMLTQAVGTFLLAWLIGVTATVNALGLAFLIAVTIAVLIMANGYFAQKSRYAVLVEAGFVVAMVLLMIGVQAVL